MTRIVVVGASLAGAHSAAAIRKAGFDGDLLVVGREPHKPYDRPPLSKEFLTGGGDETRLPLPVAAEDRLEATWVIDAVAASLDVSGRSVMLSDGSSLGFDGLVVATGASARLLPASVGVTTTDAVDEAPGSTVDSARDRDAAFWSSRGVVALRTLDDARQLRGLLVGAAQRQDPVVVCGAGFIGAEVASSARQMGLDVTVVDLAPAPLSRVLDESIGAALASYMQAHDVNLVMGESIESIDITAGQVSSVRLSSGRQLPAGVVVVGIGVVPETAWLEDSGLDLGDGPMSGLVVDRFCRAGDRIVAAGDVARWPNEAFGGRLMRVEQWDNAVEMGQYAGRSLMAALEGHHPDEPYRPVPWFWSDQFDRKIQLAGVISDDWHDTVGSPSEDRFVRTYFDGSTLCGVLAWNRPRQAIVGRQLIASQADRAEALERLTPAPS